jgi:hypothetical protein
MITANEMGPLIMKWRADFGKDDPKASAIIGRIEQDLENLIHSEEYMLRVLRQRAATKNESPSTFMLIDAKLKQLEEVRKAVLGTPKKE